MKTKTNKIIAIIFLAFIFCAGSYYFIDSKSYKAKPVYLLIDIKIKDKTQYLQYVEKVPPIIKKYGGKYLVRGGKIISMFGNWPAERVIVIRFDSCERLQSCFNSPEYLAIASLRENSTVTKSIIVEGI